jgi:osmotically-inducible protein OsmY
LNPARKLLGICAALGVLVWSAIAVGAEGYADYPQFQAPPTTLKGKPDGVGSETDEAVRERVKAALHSHPNFHGSDVQVAVTKGRVVLQGFVLSGWDLRDALRVAQNASGGRPVVENLSIKEGGRH